MLSRHRLTGCICIPGMLRFRMMTPDRTSETIPQAPRNSKPLAAALVSLRTIAATTDAHRSTVRRWLREAGIQPVTMGGGAKSAIRYRRKEVEEWLASRAIIT